MNKHLKIIHRILILCRFTAETSKDVNKVANMLKDTEHLASLTSSQPNNEEEFRVCLVSMGEGFPELKGLATSFDLDKEEGQPISEAKKHLTAVIEIIKFTRSTAESSLDTKTVARLLDDAEYLVALLMQPNDSRGMFKTYLADMTRKFPGLASVVDTYNKVDDS